MAADQLGYRPAGLFTLDIPEGDIEGSQGVRDDPCIGAGVECPPYFRMDGLGIPRVHVRNNGQDIMLQCHHDRPGQKGTRYAEAFVPLLSLDFAERKNPVLKRFIDHRQIHWKLVHACFYLFYFQCSILHSGWLIKSQTARASVSSARLVRESSSAIRATIFSAFALGQPA